MIRLLGTGATIVSFRKPNCIPDQLDAREHRREKNRHANDTRSEKLQVASFARLLKDRPETEPKSDQIQHWLTQGGKNARTRSYVPR